MSYSVSAIIKFKVKSYRLNIFIFEKCNPYNKNIILYNYVLNNTVLDYITPNIKMYMMHNI